MRSSSGRAAISSGVMPEARSLAPITDSTCALPSGEAR